MNMVAVKNNTLLPAVIALTLIAGQAQSANFRWLNFSPERHFTDEDWSILTETADQALNNGKDGEKFTWSNPQSGNSGTLTPGSASNTEGQQNCRSLTITSEASGLTSSGRHRLCKQPDGEWRIVRN